MPLGPPVTTNLGSVLQGTGFTVNLTFTDNGVPTNPPTPLVILSTPVGPNEPVVIKPTLIHMGTGLYSFDQTLVIPEVWTGTVYGGWGVDENPQLFTITVVTDPNYGF